VLVSRSGTGSAGPDPQIRCQSVEVSPIRSPDQQAESILRTLTEQTTAHAA
jgi:hypothetical protein